MNDDFKDPDKETQFRHQDDKETQDGVAHRSPPPWKDGDQLGDFELEELLGHGTSGFVYRVKDTKTNRNCALKILRLGDPEDLLRNKLGFRRMMTVDHPNLRRVDRIHQIGSYIGLAMEEIEGQTLKEAINDYKSLPLEQAYQQLLKLMRDFASGLAMIHAKGYVHRDVKPDNLMVDRDGNGRLIDYGLVDTFELGQATFNNRGFLLGTPHYFSPEVIWNQRYIPAGDIFSLGIVMLEALGSIQSATEKTKLTRSKHDNAEDAERIHVAIQDLDDSIPSTIRETCIEMLDRDPAERPTALQLARLGIAKAEPIAWPVEDPILGRTAEIKSICDWANRIFEGEVGRFHLSGSSGLGKTRIANEVIEYIESRKWGQVFYAQCRPREDQSLQAFDQICDAITNRYMQGDRERIELDPVSTEILHGIFPVLKSVVKCSMQLAPAGQASERADAMEAAVRMSEQLRLVGPLFLILDDAQWADKDSLAVLDRLQTALGSVGLGIITISRAGQDRQLVPPTMHLELGPLAEEEAVEILRQSAQRWGVPVSDQLLRNMAKAANRIPFRLLEMGDEFRPNGVFSQVDSSSETSCTVFRLEELWRDKFAKLSEEAKLVLLYVVTAGGPVSTNHLGQLTGQDDTVDAAVSDLARQRLVIDEATGGDCIYTYHDHVAEELAKLFSEEAMRQAHHAWAVLLANESAPRKLAARIAGHFIAAGEPGRAVSHALLAAEDAEDRVSPCEAGRWYSCVIDHVDGDEKRTYLRKAAKCYMEADMPVESAELHDQLAEEADLTERIECQTLAIALLVQSGRFSVIRERLVILARELNLPKPKATLPAILAMTAERLRMAMPWTPSLIQCITKNLAQNDKSAEAETDHPGRHQQRLRLSLSLIRPMSMFDNLYAAELSISTSRFLRKCGSAVQQAHAAIGESVFACYDKGARRKRGEANLQSLKPLVDQMNNPEASGDWWAGFAYSHALAGRWKEVHEPVANSIAHYEDVSQTFGFAKTHTIWPSIWASWHLGNWEELTTTSDLLVTDSIRRNDLLQRVIAVGGYSCCGWLIQDEEGELRRLRDACRNERGNDPQVIDYFDWIASMQADVYRGDFESAWQTYQTENKRMSKMPFSGMQVFRVFRLSLGGLISLHMLSNQRAGMKADLWCHRSQAFATALRREKIPFGQMLASLYEGMLKRNEAALYESEGSLAQAKECFSFAREEAKKQALMPYQLAAEDALTAIQTGKSLGLLAERMQADGVAVPSQLQRLYVVVPD